MRNSWGRFSLHNIKVRRERRKWNKKECKRVWNNEVMFNSSNSATPSLPKTRCSVCWESFFGVPWGFYPLAFRTYILALMPYKVNTFLRIFTKTKTSQTIEKLWNIYNNRHASSFNGRFAWNSAFVFGGKTSTKIQRQCFAASGFFCSKIIFVDAAYDTGAKPRAKPFHWAIVSPASRRVRRQTGPAQRRPWTR